VAEGSGLELVLWTTDIGGLGNFLRRAAGLKEVARHPGFAEFDAFGCRVILHSDEALRGHPWHDALRREGLARGIGTEIRFYVRDISRAYDAALDLGAQSITPPYEVEGDMECQVMGPDGFMFTFWSVA
jgi:hypothetical protein